MEEKNMKHRSRKFREWQKNKHIAKKERILKSYLPDGLPKEIDASDVLKVYDFLDGFRYREKGQFGQIYLFYRPKFKEVVVKERFIVLVKCAKIIQKSFLNRKKHYLCTIV